MVQPQPPGKPKTKKDVVADAVRSLRQYVEKTLLLRGERDVICKVFQPSESRQPFTVVLEKGPISEQFTLSPRDVVQFSQTGSDINLSLQIRSAIQTLDKRYKRKVSARGRF